MISQIINTLGRYPAHSRELRQAAGPLGTCDLLGKAKAHEPVVLRHPDRLAAGRFEEPKLIATETDFREGHTGTSFQNHDSTRPRRGQGGDSDETIKTPPRAVRADERAATAGGAGQGAGQAGAADAGGGYLEALQSIVDGPIEVTRLTEENVIVCNGEGMLRGLPRNALGICGTFLVLGRGDGESFGPVFGPRTVRAMLGDAKP